MTHSVSVANYKLIEGKNVRVVTYADNNGATSTNIDSSEDINNNNNNSKGA